MDALQQKKTKINLKKAYEKQNPRMKTPTTTPKIPHKIPNHKNKQNKRSFFYFL